MKIRSFLIPFGTIVIILSVSAAIIAFGRGYRLNLRKPTELLPTGLISVTSDPVGAQVLVDGVLKTATNNSLSIDPNWYTVQIRKEGFITWEKKLRVQGEVVTRADAFLFPTNPSLSPITTSGVLSPTLSPDGNVVAFLTTRGLSTLELADRPLGGRNRDPKLIASQGPTLQGCKVGPCTIRWSPDATKILVTEGSNNTLYDLSKTPAQRISPSEIQEWPKEKANRNRQKLASFKQPFIDVATSSATILAFSPDETKLLYEATGSATIPLITDPPMLGTNPTEESRTIKPGNFYVYDSREDKNYLLLEKKEALMAPIWFPTNKHLLLFGKGKIDVMEYDRTNWTTLYSGPFDESFVTPWPTGSRIVILTNLNPGAGNLPNLYTVNLR